MAEKGWDAERRALIMTSYILWITNVSSINNKFNIIYDINIQL